MLFPSMGYMLGDLAVLKTVIDVQGHVQDKTYHCHSQSSVDNPVDTTVLRLRLRLCLLLHLK